MHKSHLQILSESTVFKGIGQQDVNRLIDQAGYETLSFQKDEVILSPTQKVGKMGIIVDGKCSVTRLKPDGGEIHLNTLTVGECFGIISALRPDVDYPTHVIAKKRSTVLFLSCDAVDYLISRDPRVAKNFISFMADRISFLNKKIATFSSDSVVQKLARYLLSLSDEIGDDGIAFNKNKAAQAINSGRASLYRALDHLKEKQLINYDSKKIYIIDRIGLERISQ